MLGTSTFSQKDALKMKAPGKLSGWWFIRVLVVVLIVPAVLRAQAADSQDSGAITVVDAVNATLAYHPLLKVQQQQVAISRGIKLQAAAPFDSVFSTGLGQSQTTTPLALAQRPSSGFITSQASDLVTYGISGSKLFRNGISIGPGLNLTRDTDNMSRTNGVSTGHAGVVVNIPLLKGRGRSVVDAGESAAGLEVSASQFDLNQLVAQLITNTVTSYWSLVAASRNLAIARDAEERGKTYVSNVQALIDAGRVPRSDANVVRANLAQRSAARIAAEQQVAAARQQMALDMGFAPEQMLDVPDPADDFPNGENLPLPSDSIPALRRGIDDAITRRADLRAAVRREAEQRTLLKAANNGLRPQLDFSFGLGFSGLSEGLPFGSFISTPASNVHGADSFVGLNYTFPRANSLARGKLLQAQATARQAELLTSEASRKVSAAVIVAIKAVRHNMMQLKDARESVEAFTSALAGEREKYRLGIGSVVNILTVEDQLNQALLSQVQAQLAYAASLTNLRLATGTLVAPDQPVQTIDRDVFFHLPESIISGDRQ
jgi:outer membrane protein